MGGGLYVVWGFALLVILALGGLLAWTLRRGPSPDAPPEALDQEIVRLEVQDEGTLLFYHEEESVRSTPHGRVIVRIPGMAWERGWQDDLLRLEVSALDPASVGAPAAWGAAEVLAAYRLRAYRMTELGTDVEVERFAAPVDVFLTAQGQEARLRFGVHDERGWVLAPFATLSPEALQGVKIPAERSWAAASITGMRDICLVRVPGPQPPEEVQGQSGGD